jgi:hypothetical protein
MTLVERWSAASLLLVVPMLLAGCGDTGPATPGGQQSEASAPTQTAVPATDPTGSGARLVSYRCTSGREGTIVVDVPDLGQLADQIDRIQPCEYDDGVARFSVVASPR